MTIRDGQVGLTWLGQSGFILRFPNARILVDAFLSDHPRRLVPAPFSPRAATGFDLIACTHDHVDHLDREALPLLAQASPDALIAVPEPCVDTVAGLGVARERIAGMRTGSPVECGGVTVHAVPASHGHHPADGYGFGETAPGIVSFVGYAFEAGGVVVYHAGDTIDYEGLSDRIRELHADVALLPVNGRDAEREAMDIVGNLDAVEAARVAGAARVHVAIPMHYDMFAGNPGHPEALVSEVRSRHREVTVIVPARSREFVYTKPAESERRP